MYCKKCNVTVTGRVRRCPLCGSVLSGAPEGESAFPKMQRPEQSNRLILRLGVLLTVVGAAVSVIVNLSVYGSERWWSFFVLGGLVSLWCAVAVAAYKRRNFLKLIMWQVLLFSALSIGWDFLTGFHRWSFNFVIPILCTLAIIAIALLGRIMKRDLRDYLIYLLIAIIFCLSSAVLILCGVLTIPLPSYISLGTSLLALLTVLTFHGRTVFSELKRRFHL